jgi:hypothetical protein
MAKDPGQTKSTEQLRQEIAHSRDRLARDLAGLKYELDFPLKFRKSFQRHAKVWISAAVLTGVAVTARATSRRKTTYRFGNRKSGEHTKGGEQKKGLLEAGLAMGALKFGATLLRPVIIRAIANKMGSYAGRSARAPKW